MAETRTIKMIVYIMTAVMIIMLGLVLWGISRKAGEVSSGLAKLQTAPARQWQSSVPEGKIVSMASAGAYVAVTSQTADGLKIFVFDPSTGRLQGQLTSASLPAEPN